MKTFQYILRLTLTLFLITAVIAGLLGIADYLTADKIEDLQNEKAKASMMEVLPAENYEEMSVEKEGIKAAYRADDLGYVVRVTANGFGGAIDMVVGVNADGTVSGVSIISHAETASLGAECTREEWRSQFAGLSGHLAVSKDGGGIDALTGATVTSRAVTDGVNLALEFVEEVGK